MVVEVWEALPTELDCSFGDVNIRHMPAGQQLIQCGGLATTRATDHGRSAGLWEVAGWMFAEQLQGRMMGVRSVLERPISVEVVVAPPRPRRTRPDCQRRTSIQMRSSEPLTLFGATPLARRATVAAVTYRLARASLRATVCPVHAVLRDERRSESVCHRIAVT